MEGTALAALLLFLLASTGRATEKLLYVGELCTTRHGIDGVCRSIEDCLEAQIEVRAGIRPVHCSFNGHKPIVCCPANRIASRMCRKYAETVYRYEGPWNFVQTMVDQCGMKPVPFIIGGTKACANEYPHMALLGYGDNPAQPTWRCGGSLVSDRFVLTAAHCIMTKKGAPKWVRLGELDQNSTEDSQHEDFIVTENIIHPDYEDGALYNDIGLLKLDRNVVFTAAIRPVCLHPLDEIQDKLGIACGWGIIDWTTAETSPHLMKVNLHLYDTDVCQSAYKTDSTSFRLRNGIVEDSMICAGSPEGGKDTCKGDSGGPLQVRLSSPYCMYSLIGITSFGKDSCGSTTAPAVYTRVSRYLSWIEGIVWANESECCSTQRRIIPNRPRKPQLQRVFERAISNAARVINDSSGFGRFSASRP